MVSMDLLQVEEPGENGGTVYFRSKDSEMFFLMYSFILHFLTNETIWLMHDFKTFEIPKCRDKIKQLSESSPSTPLCLFRVENWIWFWASRSKCQLGYISSECFANSVPIATGSGSLASCGHVQL